ncbi:16S rRNA (guanine(527)-N(7))-methyltransferase RsmG [Clostridium sp. 19966]|uniref:16S rRNA (guanine(527)-N(7))-methyltransferase RsmG n=1 Tax=Clostridium sp. 19966 TaxID=2768166 RepID=UPI0028DD9CE9|nr:16S rRNA (guanine(527)-N(7))-methyltransferase RsmG [Clostridium sp. 19966]MDT8719509.1 16S rRNA (guanine(527)-N(7))-methyltransferase RsmG [Clostridium sp. 19966]
MKYYDIMEEAFNNEGIEFNEHKYNLFIKYMALIKEWNEKINLTAITEEEDIIKKHFIDCIKCFKFKKMFDLKNIIDVGTGAGFPGIPIKIADESKNVTLLDSLNKRVNFLNEVINDLDLKNITTYHSRAEDLAIKKGFRESYDGVFSRAVANMSVLSEFCLPYAKVGGYFIALKGPAVEGEIQEAENAIKVLGGKIEEIIPVEIEETDLKHNIVIVKKVKNTPPQYPRKAGTINKKPIK